MFKKIFGVETIANIVVGLQKFADVLVVCLRPYLAYLHSLRRVCSAGSHQVRQLKILPIPCYHYQCNWKKYRILIHLFLKVYMLYKILECDLWFFFISGPERCFNTHSLKVLVSTVAFSTASWKSYLHLYIYFSKIFIIFKTFSLSLLFSNS